MLPRPRMLPLAIDFSRPRRRSRLGIALLLAGLAVAAAAAFDVVTVEQQAAAADARLDQLRKSIRRQDGYRPPAGALNRDEAKIAGRIVEVVRTPWDAMLRELEAAASDDVALLGIDADGPSRSLRLSGEARSAGDAFAYAARLRRSAAFDEVAIVSHEDRQSGAVPLFAFTLLASWKGPS